MKINLLDNDMNLPLVSIVLITYNSADYVLETLESIKNLTYNDIELIVADDASEYLDSTDRKTLNPDDVPTKMPKDVLDQNKNKDVSTLSTSDIISQAKNLPATIQDSKLKTKKMMELQGQFVKKYREDNPTTTIMDAQKIFQNQIAG